ncbi:MAG: hypothetical protein E7321_04030 [Clostridiales bacterium]|nr:hypothetical protein [Clostridiales bacterium]
MEKKIWSMPEVQVAQFAANEYISACRNDQGERLYKFFCNVLPGTSGELFYDNNGKEGFQYKDNDTGNAGSSYEAYFKDLGTDTREEYFQAVWDYKTDFDQVVGPFHACDATHTTTSMADFKPGYYVPYENGEILEKNAIFVWIWHNPDENFNGHATAALDVTVLDRPPAWS